MKRFIGFALALAASTAPAVAQDMPQIDQSKLYLSSPEACDAAEAGELPADFVVLRFDAGVQLSEEATCTFYDLKSSTQRSDLMATALCDFGGSLFADTLVIHPIDDDTLQIISMRDQLNTQIADYAEGSQSDAFLSTFSRCDIDDLPRN